MGSNLMIAAFLAVGTASLVGCGGPSFTSDTPRKEGEQKPVLTQSQATHTGGSIGSTGGEYPPGVNGNELTVDEQKDQRAIAKCLKAWGRHPFKTQDFMNYRKINASVTVLGMGNAVEDTEVTPGPSLVVIDAAVSVLGNPRYQLLNPNGWYCLATDVNVLSKSTIDLNCNAHLADSKVNVNVLSNAQPTGAVGVQVLSDVKVQKVCQ